MKGRLPVVFIVFFSFQVFAQQPETIRIDVKSAPLNEVLIHLKENFGFQFAFDKDLLSQFEVTLHKNFHSKEETLTGLFKGLPLTFKNSGGVFLIIPQKDFQEVRPPKTTRISGQVVEARSFEPLPFSYILINNRAIQADQQGNFTFLASADSALNVRISHLGYFVFDTLVSENLVQKFTLTPRFAEIDEIQVEGNPIEHSTLIGDQPGG
ncbi:MAG: hypothetical protein JW761_10675, partial [Prolixibacteraceae bacterium]|nr:hypothetical protein [Prolixibacteraceae bacterium]